MLQKTPGQQFSTVIGTSLAVGAAMWVVLLVSSASLLKSGAEYSSTIRFGPFILHTVTRERTAEGLSVHISFERGLLAYAALWLALGVIAWSVLTAARRLRESRIKGAQEADRHQRNERLNR